MKSFKAKTLAICLALSVLTLNVMPVAASQASTSRSRTQKPILEEPMMGTNEIRPYSQDSGTQKNPFALDPAGGYDLWVYNSQLLGYKQINLSFIKPVDMSAECKTAIAAINKLPVLKKAESTPGKAPLYGLMSIAKDYSKTQFFLYEDALVVDGTAYTITSKQYETLKAALATESSSGVTVPSWFVYMNPNRVTKVQCKDKQGKMAAVKKEEVTPVATALVQGISVSAVKTYTPGSKDLSKYPFKAVYTFDSDVTYTLYISDDTSRKEGVTLYVESSDMKYACEYTVAGNISSYVEYLREAISGGVNPWTM